MKEKDLQNSPEEIIQNLVNGMNILGGISYEFFERGPWYKQYGNTYDPDGEYAIRLNQESVDRAKAAQESLWQLGNKEPELLGRILEGLLSKQLPPNETRYLISKTETGFQRVTPEPSDEHGWTWISEPESRKIIEDTILGFGLIAIPYLESVESKRSRNLIAKIKRQELRQKIKKIFIRS